REFDHPRRRYDQYPVSEQHMTMPARKRSRHEQRMVGLRRDLILSQLGRPLALVGFRVLEIQNDRSDRVSAMDDPMDNIRSVLSFRNACDLISRKFGPKHLEQVGFAF